jgi:hypothetical protein
MEDNIVRKILAREEQPCAKRQVSDLLAGRDSQD